MRYSAGFKASIVRKSQEGSGRNQDELAREYGIHAATLGRWIQAFRAGRLALDGGDCIIPSHRHPGEKLALLLESKAINPDEMGEWLRKRGLHSEHLPLWEQELATMANGTASKKQDETAQLKKENKRLKKELAEKEKALADAAVLLMLKKKHQKLFEEGGES